jgi:hypothetical protein
MNEFWKELKCIRERFRIRPVSISNDMARKRITLLVTDCLLRTSDDFTIIHRIPFIESCLWDALKDSAFRCDRLPEEEEHRRYGPGGYLSSEKIYTNNGQRGDPTMSLVREIINLLTDPQDSIRGDREREKRRRKDESSGYHHRKGAHGTPGRRREHHVPAKAERPALYTAQSHKEGIFGKRGPRVDRK